VSNKDMGSQNANSLLSSGSRGDGVSVTLFAVQSLCSSSSSTFSSPFLVSTMFELEELGQSVHVWWLEQVGQTCATCGWKNHFHCSTTAA
jgi:hypothetical protein